MKYLFIRSILLTLLLFTYSYPNLSNAINKSVRPYSLPPANFGTILDWQCIKGPTVSCVAVGYNDSNGYDIPILLLSVDGGVTWTQPTIPGIFPVGKIRVISCAWDGSFCAALGSTPEGKRYYVVQSQDLQNWEFKILLTTNLQTPELSVASCSGDRSGTLCVVGGTIELGRYPLIFYTRDRGQTWERKPGLFRKNHNIARAKNGMMGNMYTGNCAGRSTSITCILYGDQIDDLDLGHMVPYAFYTHDSGKSWDIEFYV